MNPRFLLLMVFLGCLWAAPAAATEIGRLPVRALEQRAVTRTLGETLPEAHHVVILIDATSARSQEYLHALRRTGYPGHRTTIVILAATNRASVGAVDIGYWREAQVLRSDRGAATGVIAGSGLPLVIGVDEVGKVVWRSTGRLRRTQAQVRDMLEWLD